MIKSFIVSVIFIPLSVTADPIIHQKDIVQFNPSVVCAELLDITDKSGYDEWGQFQKCIGYFKSVDQKY